MKKLNVRAWLALAGLTVVMGLLLFVPAATIRYWQAWAYLSIFTGAAVLTTLYLSRKDPALLERRMSGGPRAERQPTQKFIMFCASIGFIALLVVPVFDHRFGWSTVSLGGVVVGARSLRLRFISFSSCIGRARSRRQQSSRGESEGYFNRAVRNRSPSDVRECLSLPSRHAAGAWLVLGVRPDSRHDAISDLAAL